MNGVFVIFGYDFLTLNGLRVACVDTQPAGRRGSSAETGRREIFTLSPLVYNHQVHLIKLLLLKKRSGKKGTLSVAKKLRHTVQDKEIHFQESLLPKHRSQTVAKSGTYNKNDGGQKNMNQTAWEKRAL